MAQLHWISHETRIIVSWTAEDIAATQLQPLAVCYGLLFVSYSMLLAIPSWAVHAWVTRVATMQHCELSSHAFVHMYSKGAHRECKLGSRIWLEVTCCQFVTRVSLARWQENRIQLQGQPPVSPRFKHMRIDGLASTAACENGPPLPHLSAVCLAFFQRAKLQTQQTLTSDSQ